MNAQIWPPTRVQQTVHVTIQTAATSVGVTMAINGAQTGFVKVGGAEEILPSWQFKKKKKKRCEGYGHD